MPPRSSPPSAHPASVLAKKQPRRSAAATNASWSPTSSAATSQFDAKAAVAHLRHWFVSPDGRACTASLLLHLLILGAMSLVIFHQVRGPKFVEITAFEEGGGSGGGSGGLEAVLGSSVESVGSVEGQRLDTGLLTLSPSATGVGPEIDTGMALGEVGAQLADDVDIGGLLQEFDGQGAGTGRGRGKGSGMGNLTDGFSKPGSGKVVRRGRFSAWTVPVDPKPFQAYLIVIEVDWPKTTDKKLLRNRRSDLSGTVEGSDNYFQVIERSGIFVPRSNQMVVPVPGAEQNVRDVIRVKSKLLEESQELTITF